jgi:non-homologous end joining protein Ku
MYGQWTDQEEKLVAPKKPYRAWRGALELTIGGVPLPVNVQMFARVKTARSKSFALIDPETGARPEKSDGPKTVRAWEVKANQFVVMPKDALDEIKKSEKTKVLKATQYADVDGIDLSIAIARYAIRPDPDVAASDQALQILWNGLLSSGKAYVAPLTLSSANESILVIYANAKGLWAVALPFEDEMYPVPPFEFEENDAVAELFENVLDEADTTEFDHARYVGECRKRREDVIAQVVAGGVVAVTPDEPETPVEQPDLMAMLTASVAKKKKLTEAAEKVAA